MGHKRVKKEGFFFEYGLGLEANKEALEFFWESITRKGFVSRRISVP